jgi:hypothetical protein
MTPGLSPPVSWGTKPDAEPGDRSAATASDARGTLAAGALVDGEDPHPATMLVATRTVASRANVPEGRVEARMLLDLFTDAASPSQRSR